MCHMPFLPTIYSGFSSYDRLFNAVNGINSLVDISQHIRIGIYVWVFKANISIKTPYLSDGKGLDDITILHLSLRILN